MKKILTILALSLICALCAVSVVACGEAGSESLTDKNDVKQEQTINDNNNTETPPIVQPVYYTVTFNSNGGSSVAVQSIEKNGKILKPTNPTQSGYAFVGWYKNSQLTVEWDFNLNTVTDDMVLYAKWQEDEFWNFDYTSNSLLCVINSVKDKTVTEITIPSGVTHIASNAFKDCINLKKIDIPDSVISIGNGAFRGCYSLEEITIPFVGNRIDVTENDTMQYPFGYIFGEYNYIGANEIPQYYHGDTIYSRTYNIYYIPSSLKSVTVMGGDVLYGAFYGCYSLTNIKLPESATIIDAYAFYNCRNLTSITLPNNIKKIDAYAFSQCSQLNNITVPDRVTTIGNYAFSSCTTLKDVYIPNSVTEMGYSVFTGCSALENITLPFAGENDGFSVEDNYTQYPFGYLFGEDNYTGSVATIQLYLTNSGNTAYQKTYYIPYLLKTVKIIGESIKHGAFYNCEIFTVIIGNNVKSISSNPFARCGCKIQWDNNPTIKDIGYYAFNQYFGIDNEFIIPQSVTSIGAHAFRGCGGNLESIVMSDNVDEIGSYAFKDCFGLKNIELSKNIKVIPEYTFQGCSSLTDITIPDCVERIGDYAFNQCRSLESVIIGTNIEYIGEKAFYECSNLSDATFRNFTFWKLTSQYANNPTVYLGSDKFNNNSTNAQYLKTTYAHYKWMRVDTL